MIDEKELLSEIARTCPESYRLVAKVVSNIPTIEIKAIPISWIRSQIDFGKWQELVQRWRENIERKGNKESNKL